MFSQRPAQTKVYVTKLLFLLRDSVSTECVGVLDGINWDNPPKSPEKLGEEWEEVTKPGIPGLTRTFRHRKYRLLINFDKGNPSAPQKADKYRDHWHRLNPNKTGKQNYYLDSQGKPAGKGTKPSHIFPRK